MKGRKPCFWQRTTAIYEHFMDIPTRQEYKGAASANPDRSPVAGEKHPDEIHLLLTDVMMPEMNGRELTGGLHTQRPAIKSLLYCITRPMWCPTTGSWTKGEDPLEEALDDSITTHHPIWSC